MERRRNQNRMGGRKGGTVNRPGKELSGASGLSPGRAVGEAVDQGRPPGQLSGPPIRCVNGCRWVAVGGRWHRAGPRATRPTSALAKRNNDPPPWHLAPRSIDQPGSVAHLVRHDRRYTVQVWFYQEQGNDVLKAELPFAVEQEDYQGQVAQREVSVTKTNRSRGRLTGGGRADLVGMVVERGRPSDALRGAVVGSVRRAWSLEGEA
jgi:hypothetical protein